MYKNKSLLKGKLNTQIASPLLNLTDSGLLPQGLCSCLYDDEGCATQETPLVEAGYLREYLYDLKNATRNKKKPTGNSFRASYKSLPFIMPSNFYLTPGKESPDSFMHDLKYALYIFEVMGLHTVNPISGEFSIGAQGIVIENGKKTQGVKNIMLAGNLLDFMKNIIFVGSDLNFFLGEGNIGTSTLGVKEVMVGGA